MIKFLEIKHDNEENNLKYKNFAKNLYNEAFPIEERWDFDSVFENKLNNNCKFYSFLDGDTPIGIAIIWNLEYFNFIEYLAIDKKCRGKNYGSKILTQILESLKDKFVVIEVEPSDLNEIAKKRIDWYLRFGFILADYDYNMPCFDYNNKKNSVLRMKIMTTKKIETKEEHDKITNYLYENVYKPRLDEKFEKYK